MDKKWFIIWLIYLVFVSAISFLIEKRSDQKMYTDLETLSQTWDEKVRWKILEYCEVWVKQANLSWEYKIYNDICNVNYRPYNAMKENQKEVKNKDDKISLSTENAMEKKWIVDYVRKVYPDFITK